MMAWIPPPPMAQREPVPPICAPGDACDTQIVYTDGEGRWVVVWPTEANGSFVAPSPSLSPEPVVCAVTSNAPDVSKGECEPRKPNVAILVFRKRP